ncbi:MAG: MBL fold metallo-hydrolase [Pseudoxanthomonas sp.]
MNAATDAIDYPIADIPAPGQVVEIKPGVLWIRMVMPFSLDHINLWAIDDGEGWAIIDSGLRVVDTTQTWQALLAPEGPLGGRPVTRVLATHMHPDHIGMAGWLTRRFDCELWITRLEYFCCRVMMADTGRDVPTEGIEFHRRAGWGETELEHYRTRFGDFGRMIHPMPDSFVRLEEGQVLKIGRHEWEVVIGRGHSPEHACFLCRELGLFISGDQVLPKISSNTSVYPTEPHADPVQDWLDSIERLERDIPPDVLVLPSHNEPFTGLPLRLEQLRASTHKRHRRIRDMIAQPMRCIDVVHALFPASPNFNSATLGMATGETLAFLNHLLQCGEVVVEEKDGVNWYTALAAA